MKTKLALLALLALSACATAGAPGNRVDWRCDNGRAYSMRLNAAGAAEVFAGGQTYTLPTSGGGYSNGSVSYSSEGRLDGAFGGPYENCRRG